MKIIVGALVVLSGCLSWAVWYQSQAINDLVLVQQVNQLRMAALEDGLEATATVLYQHLEAHKGLHKKLDFVQAQSDWVMAARRCGKSEYKLYADMFGLED